mgnify:CR=1 FL=1
MQVFNVIFRVWHHAKYIAAVVIDSSYMSGRSVGVNRVAGIAFSIAIAISDLAFTFQPVQGFIVRKIVAIMMGNRNANDLTG